MCELRTHDSRLGRLEPSEPSVTYQDLLARARAVEAGDTDGAKRVVTEIRTLLLDADRPIRERRKLYDLTVKWVTRSLGQDIQWNHAGFGGWLPKWVLAKVAKPWVKVKPCKRR